MYWNQAILFLPGPFPWLLEPSQAHVWFPCIGSYEDQASAWLTTLRRPANTHLLAPHSSFKKFLDLLSIPDQKRLPVGKPIE